MIGFFILCFLFGQGRRDAEEVDDAFCVLGGGDTAIVAVRKVRCILSYFTLCIQKGYHTCQPDYKFLLVMMMSMSMTRDGQRRSLINVR